MDEKQREYKILKTLAEQDSLHVLEISQEVDDHPVSVDRTCAYLYDNGYIVPCSRGHYQLTDDGRQRLTNDYD